MTLSKCAQRLAVTSAHTHLPAFFLSFVHFLNDLKFSDTGSYLLLSLKCQQLILLDTTSPFLSPASPKLWLLLYTTSENPCPSHPSIPALPLPALFLVPPTRASPWRFSPLHLAQWWVPSGAAPGSVLQSSPTGMGATAQNHPLVFAQAPIPKSCGTGWHLCMVLHWMHHTAGQDGGTGKAHAVSPCFSQAHTDNNLFH